MSAALVPATNVEAELRAVVRDVIGDQSQRDELSRTLARLDLYGLSVAAERGGVGAPTSCALAVLEELAWGASAEGYLHDGVLAPALLTYLDADEATGPLLAGLAAGTRHVATAVEGAADDRRVFDVAGPAGQPTVSGRGGPLDADTRWDTVLVLARDGMRHVLALVPAGVAGVRFDPAVDPSGRPVTTVTLDAVALTGCPTIQVDAAALEDIATLAAAAATARMVGAARRSLELTLRHVRTREQFGRLLAAFQAVQMRCADLARDVDSSECVHRRAVAAIDSGSVDRHRLASIAAAWAGESCVRATQTAHLLHGALGFTAEFELHRHSVTALNARTSAPVAYHRSRVARLMSHNPPDRSVT